MLHVASVWCVPGFTGAPRTTPSRRVILQIALENEEEKGSAVPNRHLFALVACGRLAGVCTQVDMSRLAGSKSKSSQRGKRDHAVSGLSKATQDFEQAARAVASMS